MQAFFLKELANCKFTMRAKHSYKSHKENGKSEIMHRDKLSNCYFSPWLLPTVSLIMPFYFRRLIFIIVFDFSFKEFRPNTSFYASGISNENFHFDFLYGFLVSKYIFCFLIYLVISSIVCG